MLGQESVVIRSTTFGSTTLSCTLAEVSDSREFGEAGFDPTRTLTAVCLSSALPVASLLQKTATARAESFRVVGVGKGATFTTLTLESITKA